MDIHQGLWVSACGIEDALHALISGPFKPPSELELKFNGGVSLGVSKHYARILTSGGLPENARILDLGCGFGRIAMQLTELLGPQAQYFGLDPNTDGLAWAQRTITPRYPNFSFQRVDIKSLPYNPGGMVNGSEFRFPFEDGSLDLVFMISVLTHVDLQTVETYAREAARTLKPDSGRLVTTIFLLDDEVERLLAAGHGAFKMLWPHGPSRVENPDNPELAIAHPRQAVLNILHNAGFAHSTVFNGGWSGKVPATPMDFQDLVIADRSAGAVHEVNLQTAFGAVPVSSEAQRMYDKVASLVDQQESRLARFNAWSLALSFNAFWWACDGLTLALADEHKPSPHSWRLQFDAWRELGLDSVRPTDATSVGSFTALDDASMIGLLVKVGLVLPRHVLMSALQEAMANGLRVHDAMKEAKRFVLLGTDRPPQSAWLPEWS